MDQLIPQIHYSDFEALGTFFARGSGTVGGAGRSAVGGSKINRAKSTKGAQITTTGKRGSSSASTTKSGTSNRQSAAPKASQRRPSAGAGIPSGDRYGKGSIETDIRKVFPEAKTRRK